MSLRIRDATAEDAERLLDFIRALAAYEREPDAVETDAETLRRQLASERPPFEAVLAEWDGTPVGFALYFYSYSTWRGAPGLYLEDLYVDPSYRGRGIGQTLLFHLAGRALARGCKRMEWSVLDWNEPARAFYEALGARPLTEWVRYRLSGAALEAAARRARDEARGLPR
ncbi:MAG: GNAT family N-acetyltransferase [Deltaproteobacteria bacterium]|nr:MAG: GNAT family N-acetyltransferase [Deltaproteobacteria bacterium]